MNYPNSENYSPFEVLTENFGQSETTWDNFSYKISSTPLTIQDLILGVSAEEFILDITQQLNLQEYQSKNLALIVGEVILGDLFAGDMAQTISEKLGIDLQTAQQIRDKIVKELFAPAIEDIKKIQREKFPDRTKQGTPPQPQTTSPVNQSNVIDLRNQT